MIIRPTIRQVDHVLRRGAGGGGLPWEGRPGKRGEVAPPAGSDAQLVLHLIGDSATWSGDTLTAWPSEVGPTPETPPGGTAPTRGTVANGHTGVRFDQAAGNAMLFDGDITTEDSEWTLEVVWADTAFTAVATARGYLLYAWNTWSTGPYNRLIFEQQTNSDPHPGYFDNWPGADTFQPGDPATNGHHIFYGDSYLGTRRNPIGQRTRLRVNTWRLAENATEFYEDGVLLGSNVHFTKRPMHNEVWLAGGDTIAGAPQMTGTIYELKLWRGVRSQSEIITSAEAQVTKYSVRAPYAGDSPIDIFGARLVAFYDFEQPYYCDLGLARALNAAANRLNIAAHPLSNNIGLNGAFGPQYRWHTLDNHGGLELFADRPLSVDSLAYLFSGDAGLKSHIFAVVAGHAASTGGRIVAATRSTSTTPIHELTYFANTTPGVTNCRRTSDANVSRSASIASSANIGTTKLIGFGHDEDSGTPARVRNGTQSATAATAIGQATLDWVTIGARRTSTGWVGGDTDVSIGALGFLSDVPTQAEWDELHAWAQAAKGASAA